MDGPERSSKRICASGKERRSPADISSLLSIPEHEKSTSGQSALVHCFTRPDGLHARAHLLMSFSVVSLHDEAIPGSAILLGLCSSSRQEVLGGPSASDRENAVGSKIAERTSGIHAEVVLIAFTLPLPAKAKGSWLISLHRITCMERH